MKDLDQILTEVNQAVETYETCKLSLTTEQSDILRVLSSNFHFLAEHRIKYHEAWLSVYFNSKAASVSAKEREADMAVRELYKVRHFMASISKVMDSLRSTISSNRVNG
jgi:hypothetical protein